MPSVLVVDDEVAMREFYNRALIAGGYHSIDVRTAEEALDQLTLSGDIGVVVADLHMPGHGGVWLVEQMRDRFPNIPVILATANDQVAGTLALQRTITSYLVKPIDIRTLLDSVAEAIAWHKQHGASTAKPDDNAIDQWLDRKLTHAKRDDGAE